MLLVLTNGITYYRFATRKTFPVYICEHKEKEEQELWTMY